MKKGTKIKIKKVIVTCWLDLLLSILSIIPMILAIDFIDNNAIKIAIYCINGVLTVIHLVDFYEDIRESVGFCRAFDYAQAKLQKIFEWQKDHPDCDIKLYRDNDDTGNN